MATKNLGQVAGIIISNTSPSNLNLIWYDITEHLHKVYNFETKRWEVLNKNSIIAINYSDLVDKAQLNGLTIGAVFQIKDKGNILATAVTSTKVQYTDLLGNIIIDDLGTNVESHIISSNILLDGVRGNFNENVLNFIFNENTLIPDFILGKKRINNEDKLIKVSANILISNRQGNSLRWLSGLYCSVINEIQSILDVPEGIASYDSFVTTVSNINLQISNLQRTLQTINTQITNTIKQSVSDVSIFNKKLTSDLELQGEPIDVIRNDTLYTIISKIQKYINKFKYATGIRLADNFTPIEGIVNVNRNDNLNSAIQKLQGGLTYLNDSLTSLIEELDNYTFFNYDVIETPETEISINNNLWQSNPDLAKVRFSIHNGVLTLIFPSWIELQFKNGGSIISSQVDVYEDKFFQLGFDSNLVSQLITYLSKFTSKLEDTPLSENQIFTFFQKIGYNQEDDTINWAEIKNMNVNLIAQLILRNNKLGIVIKPYTSSYKAGGSSNNTITYADEKTKLSDFLCPDSTMSERYISLLMRPAIFKVKIM